MASLKRYTSCLVAIEVNPWILKGVRGSSEDVFVEEDARTVGGFGRDSGDGE